MFRTGLAVVVVSVIVAWAGVRCAAAAEPAKDAGKTTVRFSEDYGKGEGKVGESKIWKQVDLAAYKDCTLKRELTDDALVFTCPPPPENTRGFGFLDGNVGAANAELPLTLEMRMKCSFTPRGMVQLYYCFKPNGWLVTWDENGVSSPGAPDKVLKVNTTEWQTYRLVAKSADDVRIFVEGVPGNGLAIPSFKHEGKYFQLRVCRAGGFVEIDRSTLSAGAVSAAGPAPVAADDLRTVRGDEKPLVARQESRMNMKQTGDSVEVDTGGMQFTLDQRTGALNQLSIGPKTVIAANSVPPLFATLMESAAYDGAVDYAPRTMLPGKYTFRGIQPKVTEQEFSASGQGTIEFPGGDAIDFTLTWTAAKDSSHLKTAVSINPRGEFRNRFIREIGLRQPLSLNFRKRVMQAGDQGMWWDTRYHYDFTKHVVFFEHPDTNWWRHFYVDQDTDHSYGLWRSESEDTSGLYAFRGRKAAGWVMAYDETGGALMACRQLAERAPKCLYVNADGGAEGVLYLHGPMHAARSMNDPALRKSLFGAAHEVDWVFFSGQQELEQPDRVLAKAWGVTALPSDGPLKFAPVDDEINLLNAGEAQGSLAPLVAGGAPLPRGAVKDARNVRLFVRGQETPVQAQPLAYWPDRSVKWVLLVFPLNGRGGYGFEPGTGEGDETAFRVTLRQGEPVPCALKYGVNVKPGKVTSPLSAKIDGDAVSIETGPLSMRLGKGEQWLSEVKLDGKPVLRADKAPQAYVDFFRPAGVYPVGTTHPEGALDPGPVQIEKVELEESGSLRTVVRLEGRAMAQEPARVILRLEAYAGKPFVRLYYTTEFMQRDPRQVFVRRMGLRLPLAAQGGIIATVAGGQGGPVALQPAAVTGLQQTSHLNYELWQAERDHPWREVRESGFRSRGWLSAGDTQAGMAVVVRDMWQEFPKELVFRQEDGAFEIGLWPENAPLMDVRRYSNYGHIGQGESAGEDPSWVVDRYYAKDFARGPFVGVSKTDELLLLFHRGASPSQLDAVAADFQSRPLVYAGWDTYARTGITMPMNSPDDPKFARLNANLINAADWWLFHQRCYGWYGMWNYGDVQHMFHGGYGQIYTSDALAKILQLPAAKRTPENLSGYAAKADYFCQNDWAYDNGRWGWGNTEGLPNHFMSLSYLRTGRRDLFFFMEANARHSRDVVARHAGGWLGAGTRHGVQPWSDGNHEERQTVFSEQRFHYLLTGEHRTREWIRALAEKVYLVSPSNNYAAHCARSYNLLFFWEITGDPDVGATLQQYMHCLAQPEGIVVNANVRFPQGTLIDKSGVPHVANWMFTNFGAMHAMLEYYYLTQDAQVRDAFLHEAEFILKTENPPLDKSYGMMSKVMAFAARHAPDGTPYRNAIREWMTGFGLRRAFQAVTTNRAHWAGETAFFGSGLVSAQLFWLNDAMYVAGALPEEPALTPKDLAAFKQAEDRPVIARPRAPRDSWQSEYDRPEFKEYFKEHLRPETGK